jgi:hypothetical protein
MDTANCQLKKSHLWTRLFQRTFQVNASESLWRVVVDEHLNVEWSVFSELRFTSIHVET